MWQQPFENNEKYLFIFPIPSIIIICSLPSSTMTQFLNNNNIMSVNNSICIMCLVIIQVFIM